MRKNGETHRCFVSTRVNDLNNDEKQPIHVPKISLQPKVTRLTMNYIGKRLGRNWINETAMNYILLSEKSVKKDHPEQKDLLRTVLFNTFLLIYLSVGRAIIRALLPVAYHPVSVLID